MPAIHPARLKVQISKLEELASNPSKFVTSLKDLLDYYSDRIRKPGRGISTLSIINSYNAPQQVSKKIERMLYPQIISDIDIALSLADELWKENWLELKMMALDILGRAPPNPPEIIINRLNSWGRERREDRVLDESFVRGLSGLWRGEPELFFELLNFWLNSQDRKIQILGLRVIPPLVRDPDFINLPKIFQSITPFVQQVSLTPKPEIISAIRELARRSPRETSFFLKRNLTLSENKNIYMLIRQSLDAFSPEIRENLLSFLHHRREEFGEH